MKAELVLGNLKREREALNSKLERLETALSKEWQDEDQEYLCTQQYNAMCLYAHILDERITDIEMKLEERKLAAKEDASDKSSCTNKQVFNNNDDFESYEKNCGCKDPEDGCKHNTESCTDSIMRMIEDIFGLDGIDITWKIVNYE